MQQKALEKGLEIVPLEVRLIRIKTAKGSYVLMTSLIPWGFIPRPLGRNMFEVRKYDVTILLYLFF